MAEDDTPEDRLPAETVNAADPASLRESRRTQRRAQEQGDEFWRKVMADEVGRREIWSFLQACHTFEERFACGPNGFPQPEASHYQAGERDTGLRLYRSLMRIDHDKLHQMHVEHDAVFAKSKRRKTEE
jgi:hypothetical protein